MLLRSASPSGALVYYALSLAVAGTLAWLIFSSKERKTALPKLRDKELPLLTPSARVELRSTQASSLECEKKDDYLRSVYEGMADKFEKQGLDTQGIASLQSWFNGYKPSDAVALPWPKRYDEFDPPLPKNSVRLLVVPLSEFPEIVLLAVKISQSILRLLPPGTKVFANQRSNYHCTVFHTSYPSDPRPSVTLPDGGVADLQLPANKRRPPTTEDLDLELTTMKDVVAAAAAPGLKLDRVVMASTGTLLITWTDPTGNLDRLRARCQSAFPGASARQANIIHSSLIRIVGADQLPAPSIEAVAAACRKWTQRVGELQGGSSFTPRRLWYVREHEFSTINGDREVLPLAVSLLEF